MIIYWRRDLRERSQGKKTSRIWASTTSKMELSFTQMRKVGKKQVRLGNQELDIYPRRQENKSGVQEKDPGCRQTFGSHQGINGIY